jgi:hypothetical protein|tara:strand:+ start:67 stop:534 length:468 start_codon:yes stop_codon:yes gene_type:complete
MKKTFLLILIFTFTLTKTFACSCIRTNESLSVKVEKAFTQADLIISGTVVGIKKFKEGKYIFSGNPVIYEFEITKTIKGKIKKEIVEIASAESGASCGYNFEIGKSYLVYARKSNQYSSKTKNESDFVTSLCDRNQKLKKVDKKEFQELEKLKHR